MQQGVQRQMQIDPSQGEIVTCQACGDDKGHWDQKLQVRKISAITSPTGKEMYIQVPIMVCANCGEEFPTPSTLDV